MYNWSYWEDFPVGQPLIKHTIDVKVESSPDVCQTRIETEHRSEKPLSVFTTIFIVYFVAFHVCFYSGAAISHSSEERC